MHIDTDMHQRLRNFGANAAQHHLSAEQSRRVRRVEMIGITTMSDEIGRSGVDNTRSAARCASITCS